MINDAEEHGKEEVESLKRNQTSNGLGNVHGVVWYGVTGRNEGVIKNHFVMSYCPYHNNSTNTNA